MELYSWGKVTFPDEHVFDEDAMTRLWKQAEEMFGVSHVTAISYARTVLIRLRKEVKVVPA